MALKISFPHDEAKYEAAALRMWHGLAAVELLDHDSQDWALLLRRAHPGTPMAQVTSPPQVRLQAGLEVLANLHRAPLTEHLPSQTAVSAYWAELAAERAARWRHLYADAAVPMGQGLELLRAFGTVGAMPAPTVLLHGDLNPGNVLLDAPRGHGAHWLAIDPKPMAGDPGYDLWPLLSQLDQPFAYPDPPAELAARVRLAEATLGVPAQRICEWALARCVESILWQWETWQEPERQARTRDDLYQVRLWAGLLRH
ncbi:aminoglycoside phosphotransferase family protein [Ruania halotolerans]|uniref:aminoglycoside phosphotransferase family protein n=1 Tax=Ruania halotolerans TaxID=2897773 RepID=UPI001E5637B9|nr:aminoglycoside phosphotransferase family protein [Ruania halotolerans]UFU08047.1 aminoglycoside phosphotransferase family protein [Ruania halotolerans]